MYATIDDMLRRFPQAELVQLSDDEGTGIIEPSRVLTAITDAGVEIDGYVAVKYRTGLPPVPPLLTDIACQIARFRLYRETQAPDRVEKAYHRAVQQLVGIRKGDIKLDDGEDVMPARDGAVLVAARPPIFGRDDMAGY